jgi:hypothetical protein
MTPARLIPADGSSFSAFSSKVVETRKKRGIAREEEPIVERFKRQKTDEETSNCRGKTGSVRENHQAAEHVDRKDELRRELLSLFTGRKQPSLEQ